MVIGITGGIGTGKSTVLKILNEKFDFYILEADKIGHELMNKGMPVYDEIIEKFGTDILNSEGQIDRKEMSKLVFSDKKKLAELNNIVHPAVINEIIRRIKNEKDINGIERFVIEAALLIESGCDKICDKVWYIYSNDNVRIERLKSGRGMREEDIRAVINNQLCHESYAGNTSEIIDNSSTIENTIQQIEKLLEF